MRTLNGRQIRVVCHLCAISHALIKEPQVKPTGELGLCDICEVLGPQNAPQTVFDVRSFGDVRQESYHNGTLIHFEYAQ